MKWTVIPAALLRQDEAPSARTRYDAEGALVVVDDLMTRVLGTLLPGAELDALEANLAVLAAALGEANTATLHEDVDAARQSLKSYGRGAPDVEESELDGVDLALDYVAEGLPPANKEKGKGAGGRK